MHSGCWLVKKDAYRNRKIKSLTTKLNHLSEDDISVRVSCKKTTNNLWDRSDELAVKYQIMHTFLDLETLSTSESTLFTKTLLESLEMRK